MKKTAFLAIILFSLIASVAHAGAVSCGPEGSTGDTGYPAEYYTTGPGCHAVSTTVYAYKDCIDSQGNACRITWNENYIVRYTQTNDPPGYTCDAASSSWSSNTNIVDPCQ